MSRLNRGIKSSSGRVRSNLLQIINILIIYRPSHIMTTGGSLASFSSLVSLIEDCTFYSEAPYPWQGVGNYSVHIEGSPDPVMPILRRHAMEIDKMPLLFGIYPKKVWSKG